MKIRKVPIIGKIPTVKSVTWGHIYADNRKTEKGSRTWNLPFPKVHNSGRTMVAQRLKGENVGNHFHPRCPQKDPEIFVIFLGSVHFWFKDVKGKEVHVMANALIDGPVQILVPPYVLHGLHVLSDETWFIEQQSEAFDPAICYSPEEFDAFCKSLKKA